MTTERASLLVADDEPAYRRLLQQTLELEGWRVDLAADGAEALRRQTETRYDLLLLDVMMPGMDGFAVCRRIRAVSSVPIILLTALAGDQEIVQGLQAGADDYITKPFSIPELNARVLAAVRRGRLAQAPSAPIRSGALLIDLEGGTITSAGRQVALTATEQRLLVYLATNIGRVLTQHQLLAQGWGTGYADEPQVLHVTMSRLRAKIEPDPAHPRHLLTRIGIGYTLAALPPDDG